MQSTTDARTDALFMASLAHAIRSRLNAVLGGLELVSQSPLPPEQARFVSTAVEEGRSLLRLVNNALELGRAEAGQLQLDDQPLDPVAIVEGALGSTVAALHQRGVSVASVIDPQTPLTLRGDPARLRQVLVNLLDNARKATEHGSITLQLRPIRSDARGETLSFEVSDTGRGVPPNLRQHLFSPMIPANGRADWGYTSLGLDLSLCRLLVEQMDGTIEYEPRTGHGSTFRFSARFRRDADFERLSDRIEEARGRRVILVDSDPVRRTTFAKQGRQWGIRARVLADGREVPVVLQGSQAVDLLLVHQDAESAGTALAAAKGRRVALLVPTGSRPCESLGALHGAPIWLSAPMRRSSFLDALMGRPVPALASPDLDEPVRGESRGRVLLVEDSEANRLILGAQLSRLGCTVDAVDNGAEAVRLVSQRRYGLVVTDLVLPDMNGLEVAAEIRGLPGVKGQVPIVAVSGGTHPSDRERCLAVGINTFLNKPVAQRDLRQTLERWLPTRKEVARAWDASALDALARDFGPARAANLVQAFVREVGQRVGRLGPDVGLTGDGLDLIRREAHALKSAARTFGAGALADCATDLETACQTGAADHLTRLLDLLRREGQEAIDRSDEWIRQHEGEPL